MAKNIKFHPRDTVPRKVKPEKLKQRGKLVEFPKENSPLRSLKLRTLTVRSSLIFQRA